MMMLTFAFFLSNRESQCAPGSGTCWRRGELCAGATLGSPSVCLVTLSRLVEHERRQEDGDNHYLIIAPDRLVRRFDAEVQGDKRAMFRDENSVRDRRSQWPEPRLEMNCG
jgi:hypothetical protein